MVKFISVVLVLLTASIVSAVPGVECGLVVYQVDKENNVSQKLYSDTLIFQNGISATGFLNAFSTEILFKKVDTAGVVFDIHLITLASQANTYSKTFTMVYGLPAIIDNIQGKNNAKYKISLTPIRMVEIDTNYCQFDHLEKGVFKFTPSAHTDLYYLTNSFGDFYWNLAKGVLEENYRKFKTIFNFTLPGKYNVYLAPCAINSVIWDPRYGTSCNPTKNTTFSIYSKSINTLDPFVVNHTAVLRNYGYAPMFLSEGLANFFNLPEFQMKQIIAKSENLPLKQLLVSYNYFTADAVVADKTASSLVRYLIKTYGFDKFMLLYKKADDINLIAEIEKNYSSDISQIESGWLNYIDTISFDRQILAYQADLSDALFHFDQMLNYSQGLVELSANMHDSVSDLTLLRQAYFNLGDYFNVLEIQKKLALMVNNSVEWMKLGTYRMMNGHYDEAEIDLLTSLSLDSSNSITKFNLALLHNHLGDTEKAKTELTDIILSKNSSSAQGEARVLLASILNATGDKKDEERAYSYSVDARNIFEAAIQSGAAAPQYRLWLGLAYYGLGDTDNAYNNLQTANFLELRPFYAGMIQLWLGKLADKMDDREAAKVFYGEVLALSSAAYHRQEAEKYIKAPFEK